MKIGMKHAERVRMTGKRVKIGFQDVNQVPYFYDMEIERCLGEGGSCICYETMIYKNSSDLGQRRVLKQFYPDPRSYELDTELEGINLKIQGFSLKESRNLELIRLGEFFEQAFVRQVELANQKELSDVVVKPDLCHFDGVTKYILYEADCGQILDPDKILTAEELVEKMHGLACSLQKLHRQGILYMDLKPSNILVSGGGQIKLFDFDASMDMKNLKQVHLKNHDVRYSMGEPALVAPEIRPEQLGEFEQNKEIFFRERVDVYSFGAVFFFCLMRRYPNLEDCMSSVWKDEFQKVLTERFRGELTEEEGAILQKLIRKCIWKEIGPGGRYENMDPVVEELRKLRGLLGAPLDKRRRVYKRAEGRLQAAYVMDRCPLTKYRRKGRDGSWVMDALLIGEDPINEDFLANLLACTQMLDTKTVLRVLRPDAEAALRQYWKKWPLLKKTVQVYMDDQPFLNEKTGKPFTLKPEITDTPFAELRFYGWQGEAVEERFRQMERNEEISWIVMAQAELEKNLNLAEKLAETVAGREERTLIAYLDERGDGFELRMSEKRYERVTLFPFGCNDKQSLEEEDFASGVKKQALLLHKYYMREWDERANAQAIWRDFSSEAYYVNSSLCSVLSIPYKLESVGICTLGAEAAAEFWQQVLQDSGPAGKRKLNDLIYLEHRRWMCFMLTEGYDQPGKKRFLQYAFRGKNDQRNKTERLHPCICSSSREAGLGLEKFSHEQWEQSNYRDMAERSGKPLDNLDLMSVGLHQFCQERITRLKENDEFSGSFAELRKALKEAESPAEVFEFLDTLEIVGEKMLDNESNVNGLWKKTCSEFEELLLTHEVKAQGCGERAAAAFAEVKNKMRIVEERNLYHDYKSSDRTILEAIPFLLICDDPIRRIHKPAAEKTWQNVVSSLIIEPEQLYLYTDEPELLDTELIEAFLREERGISIKSIVVKDMDALWNLKVTKSSVRSVLDITGLDSEKAFQVARHQNLKSLPVILFQDGRIRCMTSKSEAEYYGGLRRHLTVNETFQLCHGRIRSEKSQNYMLSLVSNYEAIWEAYRGMGAWRYHILSEALCEIEKKHYWKLEKNGLESRALIFEKKRVSLSMLREAGIDILLEELLKDRWIEGNYRLPASGQMGSVVVRTLYVSVKDYLNQIFQILEKQPYLHRFEYLRIKETPLNGLTLRNGLCYIYDNTLVVDEILQENLKNVRGTDGRKEILENAMGILGEKKSRQGEGLIVEALSEEDNVLIRELPDGSGDFSLRFLYRNRATRECFLKEGNILEAYVYHSIWKNAAVDDVKLNVVFSWEKEMPEASDEKPTINEIDLVCTKNMQTCLISCKQKEVHTEDLQEIKYFADYFGIDGKAVLVGKKAEDYCTARSRRMHVYLIAGEMLGGKENRGSLRLAGYIQNILDGKPDWKEIGI